MSMAYDTASISYHQNNEVSSIGWGNSFEDYFSEHCTAIGNTWMLQIGMQNHCYGDSSLSEVSNCEKGSDPGIHFLPANSGKVKWDFRPGYTSSNGSWTLHHSTFTTCTPSLPILLDPGWNEIFKCICENNNSNKFHFK